MDGWFLWTAPNSTQDDVFLIHSDIWWEIVNQEAYRPEARRRRLEKRYTICVNGEGQVLGV